MRASSSDVLPPAVHSAVVVDHPKPGGQSQLSYPAAVALLQPQANCQTQTRDSEQAKTDLIVDLHALRMQSALDALPVADL